MGYRLLLLIRLCFYLNIIHDNRRKSALLRCDNILPGCPLFSPPHPRGGAALCVRFTPPVQGRQRAAATKHWKIATNFLARPFWSPFMRLVRRTPYETRITCTADPAPYLSPPLRTAQTPHPLNPSNSCWQTHLA